MDNENWPRVALASRLREAFISLPNCNISKLNQSKIVEGLQKITFAMNKILTRDIIIKGYQKTGQDAPIALNVERQPTMAKFYAQMSKCTTQISLKDMNVLVEQLPQMVAIMRARGSITEAEMDAAGIPNMNHLDSDKKPKDERALHKQRAVIMNKEDCISKYRNYRRLMDEARVSREANAATAAARKRAKEVEDIRRSSLTPEQKKAERAAKTKATKAARKRAAPAHRKKVIIYESDDDEDIPMFSDDEEEAPARKKQFL